jgi:membrane associated rhomboid family serine protease
VPTVGASGAIFGILGALFVLERRQHINTGGQIAGLIVFNLIITLVFSSFISVGGHVGGLIGGIILMWLLLQYRRSALTSVAASLGLVVLSVVLAYVRLRSYA